MTDIKKARVQGYLLLPIVLPLALLFAFVAEVGELTGFIQTRDPHCGICDQPGDFSREHKELCDSCWEQLVKFKRNQ
jgi:hypothetical protein